MKRNTQKTGGIDGVMRAGGRRVGFLYASNKASQNENFLKENRAKKEDAQEKKTKETKKRASFSKGLRIGSQTNVKAILRPIGQKSRKEEKDKEFFEYEKKYLTSTLDNQKKIQKKYKEDSFSSYDASFHNEYQEKGRQKSKIRIKESYEKVRSIPESQDLDTSRQTGAVVERRGRVNKNKHTGFETSSRMGGITELREQKQSFLKKKEKESDVEYISFSQEDVEEEDVEMQQSLQVKPSYEEIDIEEDIFSKDQAFEEIPEVGEETVLPNEEVNDQQEEAIIKEESVYEELPQEKVKPTAFHQGYPQKPLFQKRMGDIISPKKPFYGEKDVYSEAIKQEDVHKEFQENIYEEELFDKEDEEDIFSKDQAFEEIPEVGEETVLPNEEVNDQQEEAIIKEESVYEELPQEKVKPTAFHQGYPQKPLFQKRMGDIISPKKPFYGEKDVYSEAIKQEDVHKEFQENIYEEELFDKEDEEDIFSKDQAFEEIPEVGEETVLPNEEVNDQQEEAIIKEESVYEELPQEKEESFSSSPSHKNIQGGEYQKWYQEDLPLSQKETEEIELSQKEHFEEIELSEENHNDVYSEEDVYQGSVILSEERVYAPLEQESVKEDAFISDSSKQKKEKKPDLEQAFPRKNIFSKLSFFNWLRGQDVSLWFGLRQFKPFAITVGIVFLVLSGGIFLSKGLALEGYVLGESSEGFGDIETAIDQVKAFRFDLSAQHFEDAADRFEEVSDEFEAWAGILTVSHTSLPILSKVSSGGNALGAAELLSRAGKEVALAVDILTEIEDPFNDDMNDTSLLDAMDGFSQHMEVARGYLGKAQNNVENIRIDHIPEDKRDTFLLLKSSLPQAISAVDEYLNNNKIFEDMLGANGPRKYLFLFQNPYESRATGGFIGSYGFLDMKDGHIRKFFVDGIFNPDGQLSVDVVPPEPIRKISAGWSLHDSNWFADFPLSAKKAIYFYEKGGGPTVDGVIAITPTVLKRFLEITGPITLEEYDTVINADNFMENIQYEVEYDYDKEENRPKKILDDLAPIVIKRVFSGARDVGASQILEVLYNSLRERHILLYAQDEEVQNLYEQAGWTGEVLDTQYDYINVVHSNINGYKTDGVIDEKISKISKIQENGSIINTVTIEKTHTGGDTPYDFFNEVNADYMRLYVPQGSQLLSVEGHTKETVRDPLDYEELGFSWDSDVKAIEKSMVVDEESGTQIFQESEKTVFGNWVYVSPKETVAVTYTYILPFQFQDLESGAFVPFSHLAQKQSGSSDREYSYELQYPDSWDIAWKNTSTLQKKENGVYFTGDWNYDHYLGFVFEIKE